MEKRTVIAFVLSFLILISWSYFFTPKTPQQTPAEGPKQVTQEPSRNEPARKGVSEKPAPVSVKPREIPQQPPKEMQEREFTVETPLYKIVFSNVGAVIKSFKLKKYRVSTDPGSSLVELISLESMNEDFCLTTFGSPLKTTPEKVTYQVDGNAIHLNEGSPPRELTFSGQTSDGVSISQTFRFYSDRYSIDLAVAIGNNAESSIEGNIKSTLMNKPPLKKDSYYAFNGIALLLNDELEEIKPDDMEENKPLTGNIAWMAYEDGHFMAAVIPASDTKSIFEGRRFSSGALSGSLVGPAISLGARDRVSAQYTFYMGPRDLTILKQTGKKLDQAINFGWTDIIAKPLLYTLRFFNKYVNNYGVSIILLTILIKIIFWPLTHKSYKSMKEMQKLQPLMAKIREKYKNNKEQMNKELMGLYKTYKVNPMGGCLPMVIQMPIFFALFRILGNSIELRHAPFMLWIDDLSAPDRLFHFPFEIPYMTPPSGIPVLTLLMGASMFIQQKMTPTPGDPTQAKIMLFLPLIFTVMFINFPSGLVVYWLVNNILSIGQQYHIKKGRA
ncbi:MAG: membrane protein insertase YidC [Pseudomonadota bacterium]